MAARKGVAGVAFGVVFEWQSPLGRCVGLSLPGHDDPRVEAAWLALPAEERTLGERFKARRRQTFVGGRRALREVLAGVGLDVPAIGKDDRGAPILPPGVRASVSHKDDLAVAFLAAPGPGAAGVDVEERAARSRDVAPHVLTDDERRRLGALAAVGADEEVLLRFSAKEALYKVLDPGLRRYIGFKEVEVDPLDDGGARVQLLFAEPGPARIELRWARSEDIAPAWTGAPFFLTVAVAAP